MTNLLGFAETIRSAGAVFAPAEGVKVPMIDPGTWPRPWPPSWPGAVSTAGPTS